MEEYIRMINNHASDFLNIKNEVFSLVKDLQTKVDEIRTGCTHIKRLTDEGKNDIEKKIRWWESITRTTNEKANLKMHRKEDSVEDLKVLKTLIEHFDLLERLIQWDVKFFEGLSKCSNQLLDNMQKASGSGNVDVIKWNKRERILDEGLRGFLKEVEWWAGGGKHFADRISAIRHDAQGTA
ncbi:hypothetical protein NHQ30_002568 [Ciborinia camelliae]|nr:hypothetical protein NHQ30_002568 [Ciborinia camelliae]